MGGNERAMIKEEMDVMTTEAGESITGCGKLKESLLPQSENNADECGCVRTDDGECGCIRDITGKRPRRLSSEETT